MSSIDDKLFDYRFKVEEMLYNIHGYIVDRDSELYYEVSEDLERASELIEDVQKRLQYLTGELKDEIEY